MVYRILIIIGVIILVVVILGFIYYMFTSTLKNRIEQINQVNENLQKQTTLDKCPGPIQLTGKQGPPGEPGRPGGIFQKQGPLRNLGNPKMVADRLAGLGPSSVPYLADMNYSTHQTWTLGSENSKLKNEYGGCLYGDKESGLTYMMNCDTGNLAGMQWQYDNLGRLKLKDDANKCLTPIYEGIVKDVENEQNLNFNGSKINKYSKFLQLKLNKCDQSNNQKWAFY